MRRALTNLKRIVAVLVISCLMFSLIPASAFAAGASDISGHWAQVTIQSWMDKGLIKGYPDGTFKPDQHVTRAEFMTLANRAFGYTAVVPITYTDVKTGSWYAPEVAKAKAAGYISGYPDGTMKPENPITREETATIIARLQHLNPDANAADKYTDAAKIGSWSKGQVGAVTSAQIMQGYPVGSFMPRGLMTRAEVVVASDNALHYTAPVANIAVRAITVTPTTMALTAGGATGAITATVSPSNATNKIVTWSSSNAAVATVAGGVVTPVAAGAAVITATAVQGSFTATCTVTVTAPVVSEGSATAATISTAAILGVTAPVTGATPTATITATTEYTATISWSGSPATFAAATIYTATITLTPTAGYTLTGVAANFFTVAGATATNAADSGVVSAVFPATAPVQLTIGTPTLTLSKRYDGTTTAAVTAGALTGVVGADVVTVTAAATYDTAAVGTGKTITVVYTLGGADAAKYVTPVNYTAATGVITAAPVAPTTYTLTYTAGANGTIMAPATSPTTHDSGDVVTITAVANAGYHFVNWTGDVTTVANVNAASTTITMNGNYAVTANFAIDTYTVTFNKNTGDTEASPTTRTADYDTTVTLPTTPPTKTGYAFAGWNTAAGGGGTAFTAATAVTASLTVYAQWLSSDATLSTTSTVKGQTPIVTGTGNATVAGATGGSVTITAAQAADISNAGSYITLFDKTNVGATVSKVVKYATGNPTTGFADDTAFVPTAAITTADFFIVKVTAQDGTTILYYKVIVTVQAQSGSPAFTAGTPATFGTQLTVGPDTLTTTTNLTYTWYRSADAVVGGDTSLTTGLTYTPIEADIANYLIVVATSTDATGTGYVVTAAVVAKAAGPAAPTAHTINYTTEVTGEVVPTTEEYATNAGFTTGLTTGPGTALALTPGTDLWFRVKATGSAFASTGVQLVVAARPPAPSVPADTSHTATSVTLAVDVLHEFSRDAGANWQDSNVFTGLTPSTAYTFIARVKATATTFASLASTGTSITTYSNIATLKTSSTVKGQTVIGLGTPDAVLATAAGGTVTITAAQAADTSNVGSYITLFVPTNAGATVSKVVKYATGGDTTGFEGATAFVPTAAITTADFFIVKVTAQDTTTILYYKVVVTVTPAPSSDATITGGALEGVALGGNFIGGADIGGSTELTVTVFGGATDDILGLTKGNANSVINYVVGSGTPANNAAYTLTYGTTTINTTTTPTIIWLLVTAEDTTTKLYYKITATAASSNATVTSGTYTVSAVTAGAGTITNVPFGTTKTAFQAALTKGEVNQTWNVTGLADPVVTGGTLVVTAQDGSTVVTYTVTVHALAIGDSYQGGIIAYIDETGLHGLIAAIADQSTGIRWYNGSYTITGATATALGTGYANTNTIISVQGVTATSYAAGLARAYTGGDFNDWYLPSKDELNKLYLSKSAWVSDFADSEYWSSSESGSSSAWSQHFYSGAQSNTTSKSFAGRVRAVRAF